MEDVRRKMARTMEKINMVCGIGVIPDIQAKYKHEKGR